MSADQDIETLRRALHRLQDLMQALDRTADPSAREAARELLELILDLHGLALARITGLVAVATDGGNLTEQMIADPHVRAILLMHGLHPHDAELRLRQTIEQLTPAWHARGFYVDLIDVRSNAARVRLRKNGSTAPLEELRREVAEALVESAPDLDDIVVDVDSGGTSPPHGKTESMEAAQAVGA